MIRQNPQKNESPTVSLDVGDVIRLHVRDTNPPKVKRFIIVGITDDDLLLATVYINSEINRQVNYCKDLIDLQVPLTEDERTYLDRDSFVDCSKLVIKEKQNILDAVMNKPEAVIGKLSENDLEMIKDVLVSATTIKGKTKKKYGFYN